LIISIDLNTNQKLEVECLSCGWMGKVKELMPENPVAEMEGYCRRCGGLLFFEKTEENKRESFLMKFIKVMVEGVNKIKNNK